MPKRPIPTPPQDIHLSPTSMRAAISRFERRIKEVEAFEPEKVVHRRNPKIDALETSIGEALDAAFGHDTPARQRYSPAATFDTAGHNMNGTPHHEVIHGLLHGKERAIVLMRQAVRAFDDWLSKVRTVISLAKQ
jgi:hypothetical protein